MALPKFTLYKYVRTERGWRYCRACFHTNGKITPNTVFVNDEPERHAEGRYYMASSGQWIDAGEDALAAQRERARRLAQLEYQRLGGIVPAEPEKPTGSIRSAIDEYLAEIDASVKSRNKRQGTYDLMAGTLEKFLSFSKLTYLNEVTPRHLDDFADHVIRTSPTHSNQTGRNEWLRVNQFLKSRGIVLTKKEGNKAVPLGMKHAPKVTQGRNVITNTDEEVERFIAHCEGQRQRTAFLTLQRAGLREMELATLRPCDLMLTGDNPYIDVDDRTVDGYEFRPKWYARRKVSIDLDLAAELATVKAESKHELVFGTASGKLNFHLLRECKRIAKRAGMPPSRFRLHRFRANYATHCLRQGMDLETLRAQLGHRDTEALRCYIAALQESERAAKVAKVWASVPIRPIALAPESPGRSRAVSTARPAAPVP